MLKTISSFFISNKQFKIFQILCLTTILDLGMVGYRLYFVGFDLGQINSIQDIANTRSVTFMFLVWNLFLAWIPYLISLFVQRLRLGWLSFLLLGAWLVFLPNAPYIVTDLLHVGHRPPVPYWYDTMLLFSFAWTGLILGFLSLLDVQFYLEKNMNKKLAGLLTWLALGLCAFGVYLGRYQRWNTWDILTRPHQLFLDILTVIIHPISHIGSLGLAVVMAGLLGVGYLTLRTLVKN